MGDPGHTTPGLFSHAAGIIGDDVRDVYTNPPGWCDVPSQWGYHNGIFLLGEINVSNSQNAWCEVEHQGWIGTHIHHPSFEGHCSIVDFDFKA